MKADSLNELPACTLLYLPTDWDVSTWVFQGRVGTSDYYTLTHPPDVDGVVSNKRPFYLHALDLLNATLDKQHAWSIVLEGLEDRKELIHKIKLNTKSDGKLP